MVTSNAIQQHQQQSVVVQTDGDKMVQVAEAYSYLSDQKEINLDSIPLPLSPPPPPLPPASSSTQSSPQAAAEQSANSTRPSCQAASTCGAYTFNILDTVDSFEVLEQTIIKQKRLARFKNTDLRRKILLKRTFDLVCEIMDHENGFDFEDETETINKKPESTTKSSDEDDDEDEDDSSSSDSDSDSSDDSDDDSGSSSSDSSSSSSDEEDELPRPSDRRRGEIDQLIPSRPSESRSSALNSWDQAKTPLEPTAASSESKGLSSFANSDSQVLVIAQPPFSVLIHQRSEEDLDFTELNSIDISDNYDDSAFNLQDQVTYAADDDDDCHSSSQSLKRKRNSFEETVHQNEQDLFNSSNSSSLSVAEQSTSDQQILCANPSLASLSDSTCFYNNQPPLRPSTLKRPSDDHQESTTATGGVKRLKLVN